MKITSFPYTIHLAGETEQYGVQQCREPHHLVLAIVCHMPVPMVLSRQHPLTEEQVTRELVREDEGRISVRAGDMERAAWAMWPDAKGFLIGGDGRVHVFAMESSFRPKSVDEIFGDILGHPVPKDEESR